MGRRLAHYKYMDVVMEYAKTKNWEGIVWAFEAGYGFSVDRDGNTLLHHAANTGRCVLIVNSCCCVAVSPSCCVALPDRALTLLPAVAVS